MGPVGWGVGAFMAALAGRTAARALRYSRPVVAGGKVMGRYGVQRSPTHVHRGVDISASRGAEIRSMANGVVIGLYPDCERKGYGNSMLVQHDDGMVSFFAHMNDFRPGLREGDRIKRGELLGRVGNTNCGLERSRPMATHVHLEVHTEVAAAPSGRPIVSEHIPERVDPLSYMAERGVRPV